jgi:hypothetical protein
MDTVKRALIWIAIVAATSPIWGTLLWLLWERGIRPRLIPRAEIDGLAATMIARHGRRAEEVVFAAEKYAWRNSQPFEQARWRRVRRRIESRKKNEDDAVSVVP